MSEENAEIITETPEGIDDSKFQEFESAEDIARELMTQGEEEENTEAKKEEEETNKFLEKKEDVKKTEPEDKKPEENKETKAVSYTHLTLPTTPYV